MIVQDRNQLYFETFLDGLILTTYPKGSRTLNPSSVMFTLRLLNFNYNNSNNNNWWSSIYPHSIKRKYKLESAQPCQLSKLYISQKYDLSNPLLNFESSLSIIEYAFLMERNYSPSSWLEPEHRTPVWMYMGLLNASAQPSVAQPFVGLGSSVGWAPAGLTYVFAKGVSDQVRDPLTPRSSFQ